MRSVAFMLHRWQGLNFWVCEMKNFHTLAFIVELLKLFNSIMRAEAQRQKKVFNGVLPVGTKIYRFAKGNSVKIICETIVESDSMLLENGNIDSEYVTEKNNYCHCSAIGLYYFLSPADALKFVAQKNNINVQITERFTGV